MCACACIIFVASAHCPSKLITVVGTGGAGAVNIAKSLLGCVPFSVYSDLVVLLAAFDGTGNVDTVNNACGFDNGLQLSSRMPIVPMAGPRAGTRSFTDCSCTTKFSSSNRISSLASCSVSRWSVDEPRKHHPNCIVVKHINGYGTARILFRFRLEQVRCN